MIDYENLVKDFKRLIANGKLSHAYLFFGGDNAIRQNKFIFAQSLANFLENKNFEEPTEFLKDTLIISIKNFLKQEKKASIGIDEIRFLKYFLWQKPINSLRRIAIIQEAENLTTEAQNAALKIVEEPPESALIIFIANSGDGLLPTLNSRLQKIYFPSAETDKSLAVAGAEDKRGLKKLIKADKRVNSREFLEKIIENDEIDEFFEDLIGELKKDLIKNSRPLKTALNRLVLIKQFNLNKRLQLRALLKTSQD